MDENEMRKWAGLPLLEAVKFGSPEEKEKVLFFQKSIEVSWGVKTKLEQDGSGGRVGDNFKVRGLSSKKVELGFATIRIGGTFGDSLFGATQGMFLTPSAGKLMDQVRSNYKSKFPGSGA
jgi:hypothetical protein